MSQVKAVICSKYPDTKDETGMKYWYLWNFKYVFLTQRQSVRHYHKSKQKPLLALFAQIMVALYNENLFPTDIIIFFSKKQSECLHSFVGLGLTFFLLAILPARHDWHTSLYQASLFFYTVAAIIKKMEWCHYTHNQPAYSNLQTRPIKKERRNYVDVRLRVAKYSAWGKA